MKKPEAMMFYPEAWLASPRVAAMPPVARSGYHDIICHIWLAGGHLPDDDDQLRACSRLDKNDWKKHRNRIKNCLTIRDGLVTQDRLLEEYNRTVDLQLRRRKGGEKGARRRWHSDSRPNGSPNRSPNGTGNAEPMQTETETETYVNPTDSENPPTPLDWSPWSDAEFARNAILDAYPSKADQHGARVHWRKFLDEAQHLAPAQARSMMAAATLLANHCPPEKVQFLPSARKFVEGRWSDDWLAVLASWTPREPEGKFTATMRAIQEAGRTA